jgi:hypothetical protein
VKSFTAKKIVTKKPAAKIVRKPIAKSVSRRAAPKRSAKKIQDH